MGIGESVGWYWWKCWWVLVKVLVGIGESVGGYW